MAKQMNCCSMEGYLVADPQTRAVGDKTVCNFRMATNNGKRKVNGNDVEDTIFLNYEAWGPSGEALQKFAAKGTGLWVNGTLHLHEQDITVVKEDGSTQNRKFPHFKMRVREWGFLPSSRANGQQAGANAQAAAGQGNTQAASNNAATPPPAAPYSAGAPDDFAIIDDGEDLPF